jgi:formylglycine-generating enzyme required for sulfatase activity/serine/threonine protein kinase
MLRSYRVTRVLGARGGTFRYAVEHERGTRHFVTLRRADAASTKQIKRLLDLRGRHPHLAAPQEFLAVPGMVGLVSHLPEGDSLDDRLRRTGLPMDAPVALRITEPVIEAAAFLHEQGIVHGGIGPDTVWFDEEGTPMLCGLGAPGYRPAKEQKQTATPKLPVPPELLQSGTAPSAATDVFALAAMLETLVTDPDWGQAPRRLVPVFTRARRMVVDARYVDARELLGALREEAGEQAHPLPKKAAPAPEPEPAPIPVDDDDTDVTAITNTDATGSTFDWSAEDAPEPAEEDDEEPQMRFFDAAAALAQANAQAARPKPKPAPVVDPPSDSFVTWDAEAKARQTVADTAVDEDSDPPTDSEVDVWLALAKPPREDDPVYEGTPFQAAGAEPAAWSAAPEPEPTGSSAAPEPESPEPAPWNDEPGGALWPEPGDDPFAKATETYAFDNDPRDVPSYDSGAGVIEISGPAAAPPSLLSRKKGPGLPFRGDNRLLAGIGMAVVAGGPFLLKFGMAWLFSGPTAEEEQLIAILEAQQRGSDTDAPLPEPEPKKGKDAKASGPKTLAAKVAVEVDYPMVPVKGRKHFTIGSPLEEEGRDSDEAPLTVSVPPFEIGAYEVTLANWRLVMGDNPPGEHDGVDRDGGYEVPCADFGYGEDLPVTCVTWYEAVRFANRLSNLHGLPPAYDVTGGKIKWLESSKGYRLPTEAEWEVAAREGVAGPYGVYGDDLCTYGVLASNWTIASHPHLAVATPLDCGSDEIGLRSGGTRTASPGGLYDILGNVAEWTWDPYDAIGASQDRKLLEQKALRARGDAKRVVRGSSWGSGASAARLANREAFTPRTRSYLVGVRLARGAR